MNKLEELIKKNNINAAIELIEEFVRNNDKENTTLLIEYLEKTDNGNLRDSIALALSDMRCNEVIEPIIKLLKDPRTLGNRGSLLAALEPFDYSSCVEMLISFLYEGNFEVSRKSFDLVEAIIKEIPDDIKLNGVRKIKKEINELEYKLNFLTDAMEMLIDYKSSK